MDKNDILDLMNRLLGEIHRADERTLNSVYQVVANRANDSAFAYTHEPWSGIAVAIQAETQRRMLEEASS